MYLLLCALVSVASISAQICQNSGQECFDHSDCCGGCCRHNTCIDSSRLCISASEDCMTLYCPPGLSCSLYQTPNCPGCEIVPFCS